MQWEAIVGVKRNWGRFLRLLAWVLIFGHPAIAENKPCSDLATRIHRLTSLNHPDIPWGQFKLQDLIPALKQAIEHYKVALDQISSNPRIPTAENTFLAEEEASEAITKIQSLYWNEWLSNSNPEVLNIEHEFLDLVSDWFEFRLNHQGFLARAKVLGEPIFESFRRPKKGTEPSPLDQFVYSRYAGLELEGAYFPAAKKKQLFTISRKLNQAHSAFVRNALQVRDSIKLRVEDLSELEGLSPEAIARARKYGETEGVYLIPVNDKVLVSEIQTRAKSRSLRRKLWYAKSPKEIASIYLSEKEASEAWIYSNEPLIHEITALNQEYASILGHPNYADYQLQLQMIPGTQGVQKFFNRFIPRVLKSAQAEKRELQRFAKKLDGIDRLEEWDVPYYV